MEKLAELSGLVTGIITPANARALFREGNTDPKAYQLFDGILNSRYKSDEQAARAIYGCKSSDKKYQMLKSRVKSRLLQLVFSMDLSNRARSRYTKALFDCNRKIYAARQLIALGYRNLVSDSIRDVFNAAAKYQFSELQLAAARLIRDDETFTGNESKIDYYNNVINDLKETIDFELVSEKLYQLIRALLRRSVNLNSIDRKKAKEYFEECQKIMDENPKHSDMFIKNINRVTIYYHHIHSNHSEVIKVCSRFENYLHEHPQFADLGVVVAINAQRLDTCLYLRNYVLGKTSAQNCLQIFKKNSSNWIVIQELYFLLCIHTGNYSEAKTLFSEAQTVIKQKKFSKDRQEHWKIFEAFLSYILPARRGRKKFNVHKFVNEVPVFSRDKIGYNFSIIVAQLILLVKEGDFDRVMDRYESLKSYARRYIKKDRSPRSYYFVKMLLAMIKYDFDPVKTEAIAAKHFEKLRQSRIGNQGELETLEVIPYDVLWPDLLKKLRAHSGKMIIAQDG